MKHRDELKEISPLLHQLHQKGLPNQQLPSDGWFDELHQQTLSKMGSTKKRMNIQYAFRIAALLVGAVLTTFYWSQRGFSNKNWEEKLIAIETENLAAYIENDLSLSTMDWEETFLDQDLQTELFKTLSEEEMEPFLSYSLIQMNEIELYNTLNSNL